MGASARIPAQSMCALCGPANSGGTDGVLDLLRGYVPVLHCEVGGMLPANHKMVYVPQVRLLPRRISLQPRPTRSPTCLLCEKR